MTDNKLAYLQRYYMGSTRQFKRLESSSKSPIFSHLSESLAGVITIRAYKLEERFINMMQHYLDENLVYFYPNRNSTRWLGLRLEMVIFSFNKYFYNIWIFIIKYLDRKSNNVLFGILCIFICIHNKCWSCWCFFVVFS